MLVKVFKWLKELLEPVPKALFVNTVSSYGLTVIKWIGPAIAAIVMVIFFSSGTGVDKDNRQRWRMEVGNRVYDGVAKSLERDVFLVPGVKPGTYTLFGLEDGPVELFDNIAKCKDSGATISNLLEVRTTNHNLLVVTGDDYDREGRVFEMVFSAVGLSHRPSVEAVDQAVNQYFFFPRQAKAFISRNSGNVVKR
jgi:hypothetical protein